LEARACGLTSNKNASLFLAEPRKQTAGLETLSSPLPDRPVAEISGFKH
jgi:hypothetical protein